MKIVTKYSHRFGIVLVLLGVVGLCEHGLPPAGGGVVDGAL